ncbi:MAG: electron transport complex subunit RsxG [Pseudomonadales bacterium]|nr:electron transport complex subunit RsxG [Pseudomonadales bacterium]
MLLREAITRNSLKLGVFAMITAGIIAGTNLGTKERIAQQEKIAKGKALLQIVRRRDHDNEMLDDIWQIPEHELSQLNLKEATPVYIARNEGKPVAAVITSVAPDGYAGRIQLIVGIDVTGKITGVRAVKHQETPGLGDRINRSKSNWIDGFIGKSINDPAPELWKVKKDKGVFDQFTGATITPRAVVKQVYNTLQYFEKHKTDIFPSLKNKSGETTVNIPTSTSAPHKIKVNDDE